MSFVDTWNYIQKKLIADQIIDNWTYNKGYLGNQFSILRVAANAVHVNTPDAINIQQVPRNDFHGVYNIWDQYKAGTYLRHRIRDNITRYSKYIISIFRWIEVNNSGYLP